MADGRTAAKSALAEAVDRAARALHAALAPRGVTGLVAEASGGDDEGFVDRVLPASAVGETMGVQILAGFVAVPDLRAAQVAAHSPDPTGLPVPEVSERIMSVAHALAAHVWHLRHPGYGTGRSSRDTFALALDEGGLRFVGEAHDLAEAAALLAAPSSAPVPG